MPHGRTRAGRTRAKKRRGRGHAGWGGRRRRGRADAMEPPRSHTARQKSGRIQARGSRGRRRRAVPSGREGPRRGPSLP
eukprot:2447162-Pyramimonas_sp.AAC.1